MAILVDQKEYIINIKKKKPLNANFQISLSQNLQYPTFWYAYPSHNYGSLQISGHNYCYEIVVIYTGAMVENPRRGTISKTLVSIYQNPFIGYPSSERLSYAK